MNPAAESQAFLQLAKLCQDHTAVGMKLLDKISSVPRGELSCSEYMASGTGWNRHRTTRGISWFKIRAQRGGAMLVEASLAALKFGIE